MVQLVWYYNYPHDDVTMLSQQIQSQFIIAK